MAKPLQSVNDFVNARQVPIVYTLFSQPQTARQVFVNTWGKDIVLSTVGTKLLPSVVMAQAILETGSGATIKKAANNMFGYKATKKWEGRVISNTTNEDDKDGNRTTYKGTGLVYNSYSEAIKQGANYVTLFRVYDDVIHSIQDHNNLIVGVDRYQPVEDATTYQEQCHQLQVCGYATGVLYADTLINIIVNSGLYRLDNLKEMVEQRLNK